MTAKLLDPAASAEAQGGWAILRRGQSAIVGGRCHRGFAEDRSQAALQPPKTGSKPANLALVLELEAADVAV
jgi:hypothetical protein